VSMRRAAAAACLVSMLSVPFAGVADARLIPPPPNAPVVTAGAPCTASEAGEVGKTSPGPARLSAQLCVKAPGDPTLRWRALDSSSHRLVGAVDRLYRAFFSREADGEGFAYWINVRVDGVPLAAISEIFAASHEFRFSGQSRPLQVIFVGEFVEAVYDRVLGRQPGTEEFDYWFDLVNRLVITRAQMLLFVSQFPEFRARTGTV
jgi:Domain of unknown function (DUF4214)